MEYTRPEYFLRGLKKNTLKFKGSQIFSDLFKGSEILPQASYIIFYFHSKICFVGQNRKNDSYKKKKPMNLILISCASNAGT